MGSMTNISATEIRAWLAKAAAGEAITYFRGFLALAKEGDRSLAEADRRELIRVADYLWKAAQHGSVHLAQVRHGVGDYAYLAVARDCRAEYSHKTASFAADTVEPSS